MHKRGTRGTVHVKIFWFLWLEEYNATITQFPNVIIMIAFVYRATLNDSSVTEESFSVLISMHINIVYTARLGLMLDPCNEFYLDCERVLW